MARPQQRSFTAGELDPALHARVDLARYATGLATARNVFIHPHGGVSNRPGTKNVGYTREQAPRLEPFSFNTEQTYVLEFGDLYMRVHKDGGTVLETAVNISGITNADPGVVTTSSSHGFSDGDHVYFTGIGGMTELNGQVFEVYNATATTFELAGIDGGPFSIDTTGYGTYTSGGTVARIVELTTPYALADIFDLKMVQSADTLTVTHPGYAEREITRTAHDAWSISTLTKGPGISAPASPATSGGGSGSHTYDYVITAVSAETGEESLSSATATAASVARAQESNMITVTWSAVTGAEYYNIYCGRDGARPALHGSSLGTSYKDAGQDVDDSRVAPPTSSRDPFGASGDYPSCATYHKQRRFFGATDNNPQGIEATKVGLFSNFNQSNPSRDDDALALVLNSSQVNRIRHLVSLGDLVALTSGGEWVISGDVNGVLTPSDAQANQKGYRGASDVQPVIVGNTLLYVQAGGQIVRDLAYSLEADGYTGNDLTIMARHLYEGEVIKQVAYAQAPHSMLWVLTESGKLFSLTYVREHEVWGWARHDFNQGALVKSIAVVREGDEDILYLAINRIYYVRGFMTTLERLETRYLDDVRDSYFLDNGAFYKEELGCSGWYAASPAWLFVSDTSGFAGGEVIRVEGVPDGDPYVNGRRFEVQVAGPSTLALYDPDTSAPIDGSAWEQPWWLGGTPPGWTVARYENEGTVFVERSTFSGLRHFEGDTITVLADGVVYSKTISNGGFTLDTPATHVAAGLAFTSDVETLPIDEAAATESLQSRLKLTTDVSITVKDTHGLYAGLDANHLAPVFWDDATFSFKSEAVRVQVESNWRVAGKVFLRQSDPYPFTILHIAPNVELADD